VNNHISLIISTLVYETFRQAIDMIAKMGYSAKMIKRDLKSAFRMILVYAENQWLLIFEWDGKYFQELYLPFGLRMAPCLFNLFGEAFQ